MCLVCRESPERKVQFDGYSPQAVDSPYLLQISWSWEYHLVGIADVAGSSSVEVKMEIAILSCHGFFYKQERFINIFPMMKHKKCSRGVTDCFWRNINSQFPTCTVCADSPIHRL